MTGDTAKLIWSIVEVVLLGLFLGVFVAWTVRKAEDPKEMIVRWIFTGLMLWFMFAVVAPMVGKGGYDGAFVGIPLTAACGLVFAIIWRHAITGLCSKPFTSLYDGGNLQVDPHPVYSVAQARQKQGRYVEAIAEVRKQLERFPTDVEGQLLLAQIQAEDLKDLAGAELTIERFCAQENHAPKNLVFALYSMADWHLKIAQDREAAQRSLEKIIERFPDSEFALGAAQRIAHLGSPEMLLGPHERKKYIVMEGVDRVGLLKTAEHLKPAEIDPAQVALEYVNHLERHPLDTEAREKLASIYTDHYKRLDLATEQLEQLITQPNQPIKNVVRWLNLLADMQIRSGADYKTVKLSLERIIELDPHMAAAEMARNRLGLLKLELKAQAKKEDVKLGTYEQNIGLKRGLNRL
jgi:tetratricopeptide (TPR) repeat protein